MNVGVDGVGVVYIIYSVCTDNDLQSITCYFIVACIEFSGERRGGRWVDYAVADGVDASMIHILCTDNDLPVHYIHCSDYTHIMLHKYLLRRLI